MIRVYYSKDKSLLLGGILQLDCLSLIYIIINSVNCFKNSTLLALKYRGSRSGFGIENEHFGICGEFAHLVFGHPLYLSGGVPNLLRFCFGVRKLFLARIILLDLNRDV